MSFEERARRGGWWRAHKLESGWDDTVTTRKKAFVLMVWLARKNANESASPEISARQKILAVAVGSAILGELYC